MDHYEELAHGFFEEMRQYRGFMPRQDDVSALMRGEMAVLRLLNDEQRRVSAGDLSRLLEMTTSRVAAVLNSLEKKDMITRCVDPADRRRVVVRLTEQGRNEVQTSFNEAVACLSEVYRRMGEADTRELLRLSDRAGAIAQQIYEEQKEDTPCGC